MIDANPAEFTFRRRWVGMNEALPTDFRFNGRPLAVIDFEDREQAERLAQALKRAYWGDDASKVSSSLVNAMQAALREFANPVVKPEEPTGLGAVVLDGAGRRYVVDHVHEDGEPRWYGPDPSDPRGERYYRPKWGHIDAVKVLSDGIPS